MTTKRVGIMGGSFNPPHLAHLIMADQAFHQLQLDEVRLMPDYLPPHKSGKKTGPFETRLAMVERIASHDPHLTVELTAQKPKQSDGKSYTVDAVATLKESEPDVQFFLIIGGDMVLDLPTWKRIDDLRKMIPIVAFERVGYEKVEPFPLTWLKAPLVAVSSTKVRDMVKAGESIQYIVPDNVKAYIEAEELYR